MLELSTYRYLPDDHVCAGTGSSGWNPGLVTEPSCPVPASDVEQRAAVTTAGATGPANEPHALQPFAVNSTNPNVAPGGESRTAPDAVMKD